jgi:hypothetical protein
LSNCNFNDNILPVNEIDDDGIEQGKAYDLGEYGHEGAYVFSDEGGNGTFSTDEAGEIVVEGDALEIIAETKTKSNIDVSFLSKAASITNDDIAKKKKKNAVASAEQSSSKRKAGSSKRIAAHEKLSFELNDEDDLLVRLVKTQVNEGHVTLEQVYDSCEDNSTGYNMFYGLKTRKTMTVESFERWVEILGSTFEIVITPNNATTTPSE